LDVCSTIAAAKYLTSFSIGQNRTLTSFFQNHCTTSEAVSSSWMFVSQLQEPKYTRSRMAANGWLGDGKPIAKHWFAVA
jgi:hypothetical protein